MPIDIHDRRVQIAAGGAAVVLAALYMKHRAASSSSSSSAPNALGTVSAVPPGNPPVTTADLNQALSGLNNAAVSLVSAANGLNVPAAPIAAGQVTPATPAPVTPAPPAPPPAAPSPPPPPAAQAALAQYILSQAQYTANRAGALPYIQDLLTSNPVGLPPGYGPRVIAGSGPGGVSSYTQIYADEQAFGSVAGLPTPQQVAANPGAYPGIGGPGETPL